jgi:hypothetical protein
MDSSKILDGLLLPLADLFESQNSNRVVTYEASEAEEFEIVRECKANLIAEGSVTNFQGTGGLRFTPAGYSKYRDRVAALRALAS